jgi:hypothetical protein
VVSKIDLLLVARCDFRNAQFCYLNTPTPSISQAQMGARNLFRSSRPLSTIWRNEFRALKKSEMCNILILKPPMDHHERPAEFRDQFRHGFCFAISSFFISVHGRFSSVLQAGALRKFERSSLIPRK